MQLEVVTPTGTAATADADEIIVPGAEGEFDVLPGHTPFVSAMKPGVLRYRKGGDFRSLTVGAGLVEVTGGDRVIVLAETATLAG